MAGKRLSEFAFYTQDEQFDIKYFKSETRKEQLCREYRQIAVDKLLDHIFVKLQTGGYSPNQSMADFLSFFVSFLDEEFGVSLGKKQVEEFTELFVELNNRSHLWLNGGWSPNDLSRSFGRRPENISIGPNLKKLFESGEMDRTKFEKRLKELGIKLSD